MPILGRSTSHSRIRRRHVRLGPARSGGKSPEPGQGSRRPMQDRPRLAPSGRRRQSACESRRNPERGAQTAMAVADPAHRRGYIARFSLAAFVQAFGRRTAASATSGAQRTGQAGICAGSHRSRRHSGQVSPRQAVGSAAAGKCLCQHPRPGQGKIHLGRHAKSWDSRWPRRRHAGEWGEGYSRVFRRPRFQC